MTPTFMPPIFEERPQYLYVCLQGEYTFDSTIHSLKEAIAMSKKRGLQKVLLDIRDLEGSIADTDRRRVADLLQQETGPEFHLAVLRTEKTGPPNNILEESASIVGRNAKAFFSEDEAGKWLGVPLSQGQKSG